MKRRNIRFPDDLWELLEKKRKELGLDSRAVLMRRLVVRDLMDSKSLEELIKEVK